MARQTGAFSPSWLVVATLGRVRRVDSQGIISTVAGTEEGDSGEGGPAVDAKLGYLARLSMDGKDLLIANQSNSSIMSLLLG